MTTATAIAPPAPPSDVDAEVAILGSVLLDPAQMDRLVGFIRPEDFYVGRHRALFDLMCRHHEQAGTVDVVTLRAAMSPDLLATMDGGAYFGALLASVCHGASARNYASVVVDRAKQRALLSAAYEIQRAAHEHQDPRAILEMARGILATAERSEGRGPVTVESLLDEAFAEIGSSVTNQGIGSGYHAIDGLIGGMEPGQMIVLGGRPSMGKSALGLNVGLRVASQGIPVGYLSYEMTRRQLVRRAVACHSGVSTRRLKGGALLSESEIDRLNEACAILKASPLVVDDTEGCTPEVMRARCRVLVQKFGAKVLIVDHLHLMRPPERDRTVRSATDAMTLISHAVKAMAVELQVPVIALAQLNREAAKANRDTGKRRHHDDDPPAVSKPTLTDLRDSGALEQDADIVALIHRDGYYTKDPFDRTAEVLIAKNRDGEVGTAKLAWVAECQRFTDIDPTAVTGGR